jgi:peptidoglycan/xylan/chitin deacetylase (PgdA/CDA1 family)
MVELPSDLLRVSGERFEAVMNPRISATYKLATGTGLEYNVIPSLIRGLFLRSHHLDLKLADHLVNDRARKILSEAFDLLGFQLERKSSPLVLITHDIDSEKGLARAPSFKAVEDTLDLQSIWFLPSDEYPIDRRIAADLANHSTIGSHDVRHDGRLVRIRQHDEVVERLKRSKVTLEEIFETDVRCFRSPLMQFNGVIANALRYAEYHFDFSVSCWEPINAVTMRGSGIESVQRFEINGVVEFPLTLFQDHQLLEVLRMNTREAVRFWIDQARLVRELGGDVVLLVHPDYSFAQDLEGYRQLLTSLLEIFGNGCYEFSLPKDVNGSDRPRQESRTD